ncbi:(2Fe-2S)-binding protein [Aestuariibacter halophilus]|uniref:(2Fe-2S)-binding protein n=1 Tax=Fluctibacter halophilus TaxID=226011 RepID=A0ABS8G542_9ALTE|nr:(2Fe-2S)-binding protein [Aestuariibacter halophilus]MCC2615619.1 (2Fe-2S)-binding protein [Aestuariibacter halophilus]
MISFTLNGKKQQVDADPAMPLLWALRDLLGLTGTKFGCGIAQCGACTVHLDGQAVRSCALPVSAISGKAITTIEGLNSDLGEALKAAWKAHNVPQCGYCQAGQLMNASAMLANNPNPSDAQIDANMQGNICRCGTYPRIKAALHDVIAQQPAEG